MKRLPMDLSIVVCAAFVFAAFGLVGIVEADVPATPNQLVITETSVDYSTLEIRIVGRQVIVRHTPTVGPASTKTPRNLIDRHVTPPSAFANSETSTTTADWPW